MHGNGDARRRGAVTSTHPRVPPARRTGVRIAAGITMLGVQN
ncbi:hypothetical protein BURCENBC7_AP3010 [Burkholderia cenocepacia BC7]|nr:hypothetical protein BURCENBC7_AP3010 [Burkholderia cenocepacia BC7]